MSTIAPSPVGEQLPVGWGPRRLPVPKTAAAVAAVVGVLVTALGAGITSAT